MPDLNTNLEFECHKLFNRSSKLLMKPINYWRKLTKEIDNINQTHPYKDVYNS